MPFFLEYKRRRAASTAAMWEQFKSLVLMALCGFTYGELVITLNGEDWTVEKTDRSKYM